MQERAASAMHASLMEISLQMIGGEHLAQLAIHYAFR
jgi:hypothetical protein